MELIELENIWREYDKKITENTRLNKEILKRMLISKPRSRLNWLKIFAGFTMIAPIILLIVTLILNVQFHVTNSFYIGLGLFMVIYITIYVWNVRYFLLIRKINFSEQILTIKREIAELEKYKIKITRIRYILMPFAIAGIFLMLVQKPIFNKDSIVVLALIVIVFISSVYFTFKYSIYERFRMLNREIEEIEMLEKGNISK
ncbi:MAG TPA: hypothetical protein VIK14_00300 [Ignavibacteria bacterium]